jgi:prevent-host-death family protein
MPTFTVHQAKTRLSQLIAQAEAGEEIIIARGHEPAVRLVPISVKKPKRVFGAYKGEFEVPDSFFDPLPEKELAAFEGAYSTDAISMTQRKPERRRARRKA